MAVPPFSQKEQVLADGHSIGLVGYRRDPAFDGGGYFVYRNSWGEDHWDNGYGYMPFGYVLNYANDLLAYRSASITCPAVGPAAVAAGANSLDVVVADTAGRVMAAAWDQQVHGGRWRGWWPLLSGQTKPGAAMTVVARDRNKLDAFGVGTDGRIYTAASDSGVDNGLWRGWWPIVNGAAPLGAPVAAVARDPNKLDVFVVGTDGGIYTAAWDQHVAQGKWRGWWRIVQGVAVPGSLVSVVARDPNKLDVFVTGTDGGIYTAAWDQNVAQGQWRGWWRIVQGAAALGSPVSVVARDPNKLDVFVVGTDGGVYTAAWDQNVAQGQWRGWWRILGLTAKPGAPISAVARDPNKLDVFVAGTDGQIYTAAWDQHVADGKWRGWWRVGE